MSETTFPPAIGVAGTHYHIEITAIDAHRQAMLQGPFEGDDESQAETPEEFAASLKELEGKFRYLLSFMDVTQGCEPAGRQIMSPLFEDAPESRSEAMREFLRFAGDVLANRESQPKKPRCTDFGLNPGNLEL
jgi:hypothetical protein